MKIKINGTIDMETDATLVEISKKIREKVIETNPENGVINWRNVYSVYIIEE